MVIIATSILSMEGVLASFPVQRLRRSTLVVDVLSGKARSHAAAPSVHAALTRLHVPPPPPPAQVFPKNLFLTKLPPSCDILCLHPMFGPESGKGAWTGLPLVYDRVRVRAAVARCAVLCSLAGLSACWPACNTGWG